MEETITILGAGYTGGVLARQLAAAGVEIVATQRSATVPVGGSVSGIRRTRFDLRERGTWNSIPVCAGAVVLFPAEPPELIREFATHLLQHTSRIVVLGTTSSFLQTTEAEVVTEDTPLDLSRPRVQGEEYLRSSGAVVLQSSGIYGPGRNPLDWLRKGWIDSPHKLLNVVHVEDLALTVRSALSSGVRGEQFIVTDGTPRRWGDIERWARERQFVGAVGYSGRSTGLSKRLSNAKLISRLRPIMTHTDLFGEIECLEHPEQSGR